MSAPVARVAELAEQIRGVSYDKEDASATPRPGYLPVLRAGNITDEGLLFEDLVYVPVERISAKQLIRRNDVVIAASSGSLDVVGKAAAALADYDAAFGAFCKVLRPGPKVDPRYFAHFFKTQNYRRRVSALAAGININNLRNEHLDEIEIPLPSVPEQRRIAGVLDRTDALRAMRRASLAQLDSLTRALFVDHFGDPARNPKGWPVVALADLCSITGEYGANVSSQDYDPDLPRYVRITDIANGGDLTPHPVSPSGPSSEWSDYILEPGDILFARSGATVGKAYLHRATHGKYVFAGYLIRFRPKPERVLPEVLFHYTQTAAYRSWVSARKRVVAQPNINAQEYGHEMHIPVPSIEIQEEFCQCVAAVERLRTAHRAFLNEINALFAALQHRAFRGEL